MYSVIEAPWSVGIISLFLFGFLAALLLFFGVKVMLPAQRRQGQPPAVVFQLAGVLLLLVLLTGAYQRGLQTISCVTAVSQGRAQAFQGVLEEVQVKGKPTAPTFEITVAGRRFTSAGPGSRSECGFKQSLAQTSYPEVGKAVSGYALAGTIVEMTPLKP
jgi:hypothetical protein